MRRTLFGALALTAVIAACTQQITSSSTDTVPAVEAESALASVTMVETAGCLEGPNAQFGRYLGDWNMTSTSLSQKDGKTWTKNAPARWNFTCVGNGVAIQDFWMPSAGGYGTNLRMYNAEKESWEIVWTSTGTPGLSEITARQDDSGNIVMEYVKPIPSPLRRITFFEPSDGGWDWHLDMSQDGGENWLTVVKMRATRR